MIELPYVIIATDGSCIGSHGPGGWGAVLVYKQHRKEISGSVPLTTSNEMELAAIREALSALKRPCRVELRTDSQTAIQIMNGGGKAERLLRSRDQIERVIRRGGHQITYVKVQAHSSDHKLNHRADVLARQAARKAASTQAQELYQR